MSVEKDIRYTIEHKILPSFFFEDKMPFIIALTQNGHKILQNLFEEFSIQNNIKTKYTLEDYKINGYTLEQNKLYLSEITMPKAKEPLDCSYIYMLFDMNFKEPMYFTVEKMHDIKESKAENFLLCGWDKKDNHLNYGFYINNETPKEEIIMKIKEIYNRK